MPRGRPARPIMLSNEERAHLTSLANSYALPHGLSCPSTWTLMPFHMDSHALPHGLVQPAQIVLASTDGEARSAIAERMRLKRTSLAKSTVQRWFNLFGIQPHRQEHFKISNDPFFIEKSA